MNSHGITESVHRSRLLARNVATPRAGLERTRARPAKCPLCVRVNGLKQTSRCCWQPFLRYSVKQRSPESCDLAGSMKRPEPNAVWLEALSDLHTWKRGGQWVVHKPLPSLRLIEQLLCEFGRARKAYHPVLTFCLASTVRRCQTAADRQRQRPWRALFRVPGKDDSGLPLIV